MASLTATAGLACRCIIERWAGPFRCDMVSCLDMGPCFFFARGKLVQNAGAGFDQIISEKISPSKAQCKIFHNM